MNTNDPSPNLDPVALNDRVTTAVQSHKTKLRLMTTLAFLLGFLAIAVSIFIVWFYLIMYLPKQRHMIQEAEAAVQQAKSASASGPASVAEDVKRIDKFLGVQIVLTYVISAGVTLVGGSVGVLALGTLTLLTVVILSRRVTLNQINVSLAQISNQLRELPTARSTGQSTAG